MAGQLLVCLLFAGWLCSQWLIVREGDSVIVLRGGKFQEILSPGCHWRWPYPLERLIRLRPDSWQTVTVGLRTDPAADATIAGERAEDLEWTSSHDDSRQRTIPEESLYLTGDEVAVELTAEVLYRIADVRQFALSGGKQPAETVRKAAESVLRSRVASEILDNVLTEKRSAIEQECAADLQDLLASYDLGLEVLAVHWLDVHPPRPVVESFRKVSDAFEQREQAVNEAQAAATRTLYETAGEESIRWLNQQLRKADVQETATDWRLSSESWAVLSRRNDHGLRMLSGAAGAALLKAEGEAEQQRQQAAGQAARLKAMLAASRGHPGLSQQHLYWTAVVTALESKPFTLIDPQLEGRRQIYLGDSFFRGWDGSLNSGPQSPDLPPQADTEKIEH
ncbi:MAG: protease modulator HflK [Planctomycetaceae bacterium]